MSGVVPKLVVYLLATSLVAALIGTIASGTVASWRYSRQMDCQRHSDTRTREICESVERNVEYTCCGHAIISPGYRSTLKTVAAVWCEQRVEQADIEALTTLSQSDDMRLSSTADSLIRLLTGHDQYGSPESASSVLSPSHPLYLLRDGCNPGRP